MKNYLFCYRKVSVKNRLTKSAWGTSERFLWCVFFEHFQRNELKFSHSSYAGNCSEVLILSWWMTQREQCNSGIVNRRKKLLTPGRALLPDLRCLAFLLRASCRSQLPNAFPWCGKRMCGVFPAQKFTRAVLTLLQELPAARSMAKKRQSLRQECLAFDKMMAQLAAIRNVSFLIFKSRYS